MFRYEYPEFNNKHLLKAVMMEQLRDYPRIYTQLLFQGQESGIVNGCELSWNDDRLSINSGIISWNENLYFLDKPYTLECHPEDQLQYLVVKFLEEIKNSDKVIGETRIYLKNEPVYKQDEMELCRFRLQEGARLRSVYKDFEDYSTEYDTINIIYSPFAGKQESNISPKILMSFAVEMMRMENENSFDISFSMNVLANEGRVSRRLVELYLKKRSGQDFNSKDSLQIYQGLLRLLIDGKSNRRGQEQELTGKRIMLM